MPFNRLLFNYHLLNHTTSSNIHALKAIKQKTAKEGAVFIANEQSDGRGQRGTKWVSNPSNNLTFSVVLQPNIKANHQFLLAQTIALGIYYYLDNLSVDGVSIKWPNDTLVDGKKIAGTLIENILLGDTITYSVIGIGLNVNQQHFPDFSREATSLKCIKNAKFDLSEQIEHLLASIAHTYSWFSQKAFEKIQRRYKDNLHGYRAPIHFEDKAGCFKGQVLDLLPDGKIIIDRQGLRQIYDMKEIKFID